ncbi:MAG TPA: DUF4232 domain-containing protein [Gaiellaceae bacterium]|nr:DUF4232 domain-containing protein [Gaiellaceae bacterium]
MRAVLVAVIAIVALAGCGGRHTANGCPGARLAAMQGSLISEATGQDTLQVQIVDRGAACTIEGVPKVELVDAAGKVLHFAYTDKGDVELRPADPHPVHIAPGRPALVEINKYRCDIHSTDGATVVRVTLPHLRTLSLPVQARRSIDWCPAEKPSSTVDVTAVQAAPVITGTDWRPVFEDVYDGHLDEHWSCGLLRAAIAHLPQDPPMYSKIPAILEAAARRACAG